MVEYVARRKSSLFCNNRKASFEKEEKVVNPPQNPTVRNNLHSGDIKLPFSEMPKKIPINKLPRMFTRNVPHGKTDAKEIWM